MALWRALAYIRLWVQSLALKKTNRPKKKKWPVTSLLKCGLVIKVNKIKSWRIF